MNLKFLVVSFTKPLFFISKLRFHEYIERNLTCRNNEIYEKCGLVKTFLSFRNDRIKLFPEWEDPFGPLPETRGHVHPLSPAKHLPLLYANICPVILRYTNLKPPCLLAPLS